MAGTGRGARRAERAGGLRRAGAGRAAALALAAVLAACAPRIENRGNDVDPDALALVAPGSSDRAEVAALLGAPSSTSDFGGETWFYVAARTRAVAFLEEELVARRVVYIAFDERGRVAAIGKLSEADGRRVPIVDRETATAGQKITLLQQLFGNLGRFNAPAE